MTEEKLKKEMLKKAKEEAEKEHQRIMEQLKKMGYTIPERCEKFKLKDDRRVVGFVDDCTWRCEHYYVYFDNGYGASILRENYAYMLCTNTTHYEIALFSWWYDSVMDMRRYTLIRDNWFKWNEVMTGLNNDEINEVLNHIRSKHKKKVK